MKTALTHKEYLSLVGLMTLAKEHSRQLKVLGNVVREVLEIDVPPPGGDQVDDEIYGREQDADAMLRRLKIAYVKNPK